MNMSFKTFYRVDFWGTLCVDLFQILYHFADKGIMTSFLISLAASIVCLFHMLKNPKNVLSEYNNTAM